MFRTAIGFHDAYVAATSRKAALQAWGSTKDLFAGGLAEEVTDAALMEAPLAQPGVVVRQSRGSLKEQMAALGPLPEASPSQPRAEKRRERPRPSRSALDAAEKALAAWEAKAQAAEEGLRDRERALQRERENLEKNRVEQRAKLQEKVDREGRKYRGKLADWEGCGVV